VSDTRKDDSSNKMITPHNSSNKKIISPNNRQQKTKTTN
jgi:hypothetical protein